MIGSVSYTHLLVSEDAENIVSLLYTAFNGTYYKDDDGNVIALTNIGSISTKNQRLRVNVAALSLSLIHIYSKDYQKRRKAG